MICGRTLLVLTGLGVWVSWASAATISYSDGAVHNINTPTAGEIDVYNNGSNVTTVNLLSGGSVTGADVTTDGAIATAVSSVSGVFNVSGGNVHGGNMQATGGIRNGGH